MTEDNSFVECNVHELRRRAFVCQRLNNKIQVGFEEAFDTFEGMELDGEEDFQAWCSKCEIVRQKEGEWNDNSMEFAKIKVICEGCYFDMKELNLGKR
jgi:hypothetical protein